MLDNDSELRSIQDTPRASLSSDKADIDRCNFFKRLNIYNTKDTSNLNITNVMDQYSQKIY